MNCARMFAGVAPMAIRRPISRIRSVTETSMMFMMPMPPTRSEIAATAARSTVIVFETPLMVEVISAMSMMRKSSATSSPRRWRWRRSAPISRFASSIWSIE